MVCSGSFDVHIASQLFWDVVKFNKSQLYHAVHKDLKQFWSISLHLFHAKFMRFVGVGLLYGDPNMTMGKLAPVYR